jgi:hypothetical protein
MSEEKEAADSQERRYSELFKHVAQRHNVTLTETELDEIYTIVTGNRKLEICPVCETCGGPNVALDATARWDEKLGDWSLASMHDHAYCDDCDQTCFVKWVPVCKP